MLTFIKTNLKNIMIINKKTILTLSVLAILITGCVSNPYALGEPKKLETVDQQYISSLITVNNTNPKKTKYTSVAINNFKIQLASDKSLAIPDNSAVRYSLKLSGYKHNNIKKYDHYLKVTLTYTDTFWRSYKKVTEATDGKGKSFKASKLKSSVACPGSARRCNYTQAFLVSIPDSYIRSKKSGFSIKVAGRRHQETFNVPSKYIGAYLSTMK